MPELRNFVIAGGGLAGLAAAYWCSRQNPDGKVFLLEKEQQFAAWTERKGLAHYPLGTSVPGSADYFPEGDRDRGIGQIVSQWPGNASLEWLQALGVNVQESADESFFCRRIAEVRDCLVEALQKQGATLMTGFSLESIGQQPDGSFRLWSREGESCTAHCLLLATGGGRNHGLKMAAGLGVETTPPVPAFVRLRLASPKLGGQMGPLLREVRVRCLKSGTVAQGAMEISARGLEGVVISRLGSGLYKLWDQLGYRLQLEVDWLPDRSGTAVLGELSSKAASKGKIPVGDTPLFGFSERSWGVLLHGARLDPDLPWGRIKPKKLQALMNRLKGDRLNTAGMGLPSFERAWAGGVCLSSVRLASLQSMKVPGLFLAGEILDMHGQPGGFHQNLTWATAHVGGISMTPAALGAGD